MSENEFVIFQKYSDQASALELEALLKEEHIEYRLEENSSYFSPTFVNSNLEKEFAVKLKKEDFERAEQLVEKTILEQINSIQSDYYLFEYTDDELIEIVKNKYEWNKFDFLLAQKILKERGKQVSAEELNAFKDEHISTLAEPAKSSTLWIIIGYGFSLLGGLFGIAIGWHLFNYKKTLPTGDVVYVHSESDKKHGFFIFIIGIAVFTFAILFRLLMLFVIEP